MPPATNLSNKYAELIGIFHPYSLLQIVQYQTLFTWWKLVAIVYVVIRDELSVGLDVRANV